MKPHEFFPRFPAGLTNPQRADVIREILTEIKEAGHIDFFESRFADAHGLLRFNFYVRCGEPFAFGPLLEAHFDVANMWSENCADNTGSVCTLLSIATQENYNGYLALTDAEETVNILCGANQLLLDLKTLPFFKPKTVKILCLEITAAGETVWTDDSTGLIENGGVAEVLIRTPWNHATVLRHLKTQAACVGLGDSPQRYSRLWSVIHTKLDTFAQAIPANMETFRNTLKALGFVRQFTKGDVNSLRQRTGAGLINVQKALKRANGDPSLAEGILRYDGTAVTVKGDYDTWVERNALEHKKTLMARTQQSA